MRSAIPSLNNSSLSISLMLGAIFCFASMDAVAKYLMQEIGPVQTIWARYTAWTVYLAQIVWTGPISCIKYFATASIDAKQNIAPIIRKIGKVFGFIRKLY